MSPEMATKMAPKRAELAAISAFHGLRLQNRLEQAVAAHRQRRQEPWWRRQKARYIMTRPMVRGPGSRIEDLPGKVEVLRDENGVIRGVVHDLMAD